MLVILLIAFAFSSTGFSSPATEDAYQTGVRLLQEDKSAEAEMHFEAEYKSGKNFSGLFYNWGLAAYKQNKKGLAVGLWRRALYLNPELGPAIRALDFAATQMPRNVLEDDLSGWPSFRAKLLDRVSLNKFLILTWIFLTTSSLLLLRFWGQHRRALKMNLPRPKVPVIGFSFAFLFFVCFVLTVAKGISLSEIHATIVPPSVSIRTGPNEEDNIVFDLIEGVDVIVRQVQSSWVQINTSSGASGWVPAQSLFQHTGKAPLW